MPEREDVLFELGTEELPPRALRGLGDALVAGFREGLAREQVALEAIEGFATPRRLAVLIRGCATSQPERQAERLGPAVSAAFDASGAPTAAAEGFARSCDTTVAALERVATDKGDRVAYRWREPGQATLELLPRIAGKAIGDLPIPKRMRWGEASVEFVRPVHWLVFLMGAQVVPCSLLGLEAGRRSRGHRFHCRELLALNHPREYQSRLRDEGYVIAGFDEREATIRSQAQRLAAEQAGTADIDEGLLTEVAALTEWPIAIVGSFDKAFLGVPRELLVLTMKRDQRYFPILDASGGLSNRFVAVANIASRHPDVVRQGNERVIRPRFADAKFFWDEDRKTPLADRLEDLRGVVFQDRLGSMYDKSMRVSALASDIALLTGADTEKAERAGRLCRCDLVTRTVFEFPEMQGIAGRCLLTHERAGPELAQAMEEVYMPRHAGDALPRTKVGTVVSLAEKLDTLVAIFAIGEIPTGDKDPYALRRAALGALRILREQQLRVPLWAVVQIAHNRLGEELKSEGTVEAVYDFMMERLKGTYLDEGVDSGVFGSVLEVRPTTIADFDKRIHAVTEFRSLPEAAALAVANKRARNILRQAGFDEDTASVDPNLLSDSAEVLLSERVTALEAQLEPLLEVGQYDAALRLLAGLREPVDRFFDEVLVMAGDAALRANRLALLSRLSQLFLQVADVSQLQISTRQAGERADDQTEVRTGGRGGSRDGEGRGGGDHGRDGRDQGDVGKTDPGRV
ncbi:MAG: glycine--tRNA ligase subunit beta [Arenicellales bacterium]